MIKLSDILNEIKIDKFDIKHYISSKKLLKENFNTDNIYLELMQINGWEDWEDIENEIEKIRDEYDLVDSNSRFDEAYLKFEEIYNVNPLHFKKYLESRGNKIYESSDELSLNYLYYKMEGLANIKMLNQLKSSLAVLVAEWKLEGFKNEEIIKYLSNEIINKIK